MYIMQVKLRRDNKLQWVAVKPSTSERPYKFATEAEAEKMLNLCYGACYDLEKRVIKAAE